MPNILVSNDDGIFAPGLRTLVDVALSFGGEVVVVAPKDNQSASGHRKTLHKPLRAVPTASVFPPQVQAYAVDGAPSDCVALALMGLVDTQFDIVVAGINNGPNLGQDLTYSGTVSVTLEAAIFGYLAVAFSLDDRRPDADYSHCKPYIQQIIEQVLENGLPHQTVLNVNFPSAERPIMGIKPTRQGRRIYRDLLDTRYDPFNKPYYWIAGSPPIGDIEEVGTDIWAVHHGYVSVTPIHLDMTRHEFLTELDKWQLNHSHSDGANRS
ncbi:MAG: 5'/3'-nucleotidase SurE [Phototrophicales bacterium]|nr:MAG: 5'/3'-nucleotidase SurE [Phototrophicales bacterium]